MPSNTSYPGVSDLVDLFAQAKVTIADPSKLARFVASAQTDFEQLVKWKPFLCEPQDTMRTFDPPGPNQRYTGIVGMRMGGGVFLDLPSGLCSLTSLKIGITPENDVGTEYTLNTDFWLDPIDARQGEPFSPYSRIIFRHPVWGVPRSIQIVGRHGHSLDLPADAWEAVLYRAGSTLISDVQQGLSTGLIEWTEAGVTERKSIELIQKLGAPWKGKWNDAVAKYEKLFG